jgi:hypothetical protein
LSEVPPVLPATEPTRAIWPPPCSVMWSIACLAISSGTRTLMSITRWRHRVQVRAGEQAHEERVVG